MIDNHSQAGSDPIDHLLSIGFRRPGTSERVPCPVRSLVFESSLDGCERDLLADLGFPKSLGIICDPNTYDVLAKRVSTAIPDAGLIVIDKPKADEDGATALAAQTRHAEALIAVGSGTLNDLVKYVSHQHRRPYAVFATAPSMNGYVTATASISRGGEKLSLPATPPKGAFFDLETLAEAPHRLIRAGVGDSLCRSTAELDWLLSHHLLETVFLEAPFAIQAKDEADVLASIDALWTGDLDAVRSLTRLLVLGGLGMLMAGNSQPGSQGEHLISHYIDMMHRPHPGSLHGEQVGLATLTVATLQNELFTKKAAPLLKETVLDFPAMANRFGKHGDSCREAMTRKALKGEGLEKLNTRLADAWPDICQAFKLKALPIERLRTAFDAAGMAVTPEDLGIDPGFYATAVMHARELRDRFTALDLAADAGLLAPFIERYLAKNTR
ncbi:MAG: iron-containing alcohol dehydrogenase [Pseudomonadota bacterium]